MFPVYLILAGINVFDSKTAMEFWEKYPLPSKLKGITVEELAEFLKVPSSGFFSREKAEEILFLVASDGDTATAYQDSRDFLVTTCIKQLKQNYSEVESIEKEIRNILDRLGYRLETMIGIDIVTAAAFISQVGDIHRFPTADKLAKYAGIAPVNYSFGDKERIFKNRQGDRKLYGLFHNLVARLVNIVYGMMKNKTEYIHPKSAIGLKNL